MRLAKRASGETRAVAANASTPKMLVVTQVRQAPQHACAAGAISAARKRTGRRPLEHALSVRRLRAAGGFANARALKSRHADTTPADNGSGRSASLA
jgi:hypothetical protein